MTTRSFQFFFSIPAQAHVGVDVARTITRRFLFSLLLFFFFVLVLVYKSDQERFERMFIYCSCSNEPSDSFKSLMVIVSCVECVCMLMVKKVLGFECFGDDSGRGGIGGKAFLLL